MKRIFSYAVAFIFTCVIALSAVGCKKDNTETVSRYDIVSKNSSYGENAVDSADVGSETEPGSSVSSQTNKKSQAASNSKANDNGNSNRGSSDTTLEVTVPEDWYSPSGTDSNDSVPPETSVASELESGFSESDSNHSSKNPDSASSSQPKTSGSDSLLSSLPSGFR